MCDRVAYRIGPHFTGALTYGSSINQLHRQPISAEYHEMDKSTRFQVARGWKLKSMAPHTYVRCVRYMRRCQGVAAVIGLSKRAELPIFEHEIT